MFASSVEGDVLAVAVCDGDDDDDGDGEDEDDDHNWPIPHGQPLSYSVARRLRAALWEQNPPLKQQFHAHRGHKKR